MTNTNKNTGPVVLCILDGWGKRTKRDANAIALANTPNWDHMVANYPTGELVCHGEDVGLPPGQMGNSEVGHLNLGAGRIVWQVLPRINNAIADGSFAKSPELATFIANLKDSSGTCHLIGLISDGGVHAHQDHVVALAKNVSGAGIPVRIHALTDGRDVAPRCADACLKKLAADIANLPDTKIASLCGRYFAMDRDNRWDRVARAYNLIAHGQGASFDTSAAAIANAYSNDISDEFIEPAVFGDHSTRGMRDGDGLLAANFRADRMREILAAFIDPEFDGFPQRNPVQLAASLGMVSYSTDLDRFMPSIIPPGHIANTLGQVIADAGRTQLRLSETEKYPHVTYFFNGGAEEPNSSEDRSLVPSPKVATYDLQPEMSAPEVTQRLVTAIRSGKHDAIIVNYPNGDMVGHTGSLNAAIKAVEELDSALGLVEQAILDTNGTMIVTADHGNCEMMVDPDTGGPHTAHTLNPVPTVLVNHPDKSATIASGRLADVAPTILELLGIDQPGDMTGHSLIRK